MRILVLAINYWPEQTGIGPVLTRRCEYLASAGHEVTVCTSMPYYPEWRIPREYAGKLFGREERNLSQFAANFARDPIVHFPTTYPRYCTRRVLTMELLDGIKLSEQDRLRASGADLEEVAARESVAL